MFGVPYSATSDSKYETDSRVIQGFPVYTRNRGGATYSLYKRSDGKWYHTIFDNPPPDSGGALLYVVFHPWNATFKDCL